ncbi:hypothetical protein CRX72_08400 [Pantoea sp. BRM17]|nr:hypothetical protein CRX72_08400 [Pantoea sp. BRM17]
MLKNVLPVLLLLSAPVFAARPLLTVYTYDSFAAAPLFHHWLLLEGQRSMRGVRLNTLGWFDFKSAWFAPPAL